MMAEADIKSKASEASDLSSLSEGHSAHLPRQYDKNICKGRRARAKGALTRFMNSVDILLANPENLTAIKQKLISYQKVKNDFEIAHFAYFSLLENEDDKDEAETYRKSVVHTVNIFLEKTETEIARLEGNTDNSSANDPDSSHFEFDLFMTSAHHRVGKLFFYNHEVIFYPNVKKTISVRNISYVLLTRLLVSAISDVSEPLRQGCQARTVPAILYCLQSYCIITSPYISSTAFLRTKQRFI